MRSSANQEELGVEPLLLRAERIQMRWFGHHLRMPSGHLSGEVFRTPPTVAGPSRLTWEHLGMPREELDKIAGERAKSLFGLLPL